MSMRTIDIQGTLFTFPPALDACVAKVFGGEYVFPKLPDVGPVHRVVDVGANVGAFAVWASVKFPGCWLDCYEPHPGAAECCSQNVPSGTEVHRVAVSTLPGPLELHVGKGEDWGYNSIDAALTPTTSQGIRVATLHPRDLPPCDVLKVDAEGVEVEVLLNYSYLDDVKIVMYEWHREEDLPVLQYHMRANGFRLFRSVLDRVNLGQDIWIRSSAVFNMATGEYDLPTRKGDA